MTSALLPASPVFRAYTQSGSLAPLALGWLTFYAAGTSTPQAAYADATSTIALPNPLQLDANGQAVFFLKSGLSYKINLTDASLVQQSQWPVDNIIGDPAGAAMLSIYADLASASVGQGDTLLAVLQPFTGAVATTQDKMNARRVNVMDFGAAGDGVTNDLVAIQSGIAWLQANGGGVLEFSRMHLITGTLTLHGSVTGGSNYVVPTLPVITFQGVGSPESGIKSSISTAGQAVIQMSAVGDPLHWKLRLCNMVIDCGGNNVVAINGQDPNYSAGQGNNHYVDFDGVKLVGLSGVSSVGIWLGSITDSSFRSVWVAGYGTKCGIGFRISKADNHFTDCWAAYCTIGWWMGELIEASFHIKGGCCITCDTDFYIGTALFYSSSSLIEHAFIGEHASPNTQLLTLTAAPAGTTSGTLTSSFGGTTGSYQMYFYNDVSGVHNNIAAIRTVTLTNGSTAVSWSGAVTASSAAVQASQTPTLGRILDRVASASCDVGPFTFLHCTFDNNRPENLFNIDFGGRFTVFGCAVYATSTGLMSSLFGQYANVVWMQNQPNMTLDLGSGALFYNQVFTGTANSIQNWYKAAAASGGTYVMNLDPTANTQIIAPFAGSIVQVSMVASQTILTGTPTAYVRKNAVDMVAAQVGLAAGQSSNKAIYDKGNNTFAQGDIIDVHLYCGTFTPTPTDFSVAVTLAM